MELTMSKLAAFMMIKLRKQSIKISWIKSVVNYVVKEDRIKVAKHFVPTIQAIVKITLQDFDTFAISKCGEFIELVHPDDIKLYEKRFEILEDDKRQLERYIKIVFEEPLILEMDEIHFKREKIEYIKKNTTYVIWLEEMLMRYVNINSFDYRFAKTEYELARIIMLESLYEIVRRYCEANLIQCFDETYKSYILAIRYGRGLSYIEIMKFEDNGIICYRALRRTYNSNSVVFDDILAKKVDARFEKKQKEIDKIYEFFQEAKEKGIPYVSIKNVLDDTYNL